MSDCERYERLISDLLDGPLPDDEPEVVERHLAGCDSCREFAEVVRHQRGLLRGLPVMEVGGSVPRKQARSSGGVLTRLWRARLAVPVPLAAAVLAAVLGWGLLRSLSERGETKVVPGERKVHVVVLEPVSAVRVEK